MIQLKIKYVLFILLTFGVLASCGSKLYQEPIPGSADSEAWLTHHLQPENICVVTHNDNRNPESYAFLTSQNHEEYTKKHGYKYHFYTGRISGDRFLDPNSSRGRVHQEGLYWQKITAVKNQLDREDCRWVMWIDADVIFTHFQKKIEDIIREYGFRIDQDVKLENHLILSREEALPEVGVNAGVFLVRNSDWSKNFFDHAEAAYPYYKEHALPEQDFLQDAAYQRISLGDFNTYTQPDQSREFRHKNLLKFTITLPQRVMNSFNRGSKYNDNENIQWQRGDFIAHLSAGTNESRRRMIQIFRSRIIR